MKIILQENLEKLGTRGEIVEVAEGYARNYLLPRKIALPATAGNLKQLERIRGRLAKIEAAEHATATQAAASVTGTTITFERKAGQTDQLFGSVTAADIAPPAGVEIHNPDLKIATLNEKGKLDMELVVERGRGYVSAQQNAAGDAEIGRIPVDSIYSPVLAVKYSVEATRVEQRTRPRPITLAHRRGRPCRDERPGVLGGDGQPHQPPLRHPGGRPHPQRAVRQHLPEQPRAPATPPRRLAGRHRCDVVRTCRLGHQETASIHLNEAGRCRCRLGGEL